MKKRIPLLLVVFFVGFSLLSCKFGWMPIQDEIDAEYCGKFYVYSLWYNFFSGELEGADYCDVMIYDENYNLLHDYSTDFGNCAAGINCKGLMEYYQVDILNIRLRPMAWCSIGFGWPCPNPIDVAEHWWRAKDTD